MHHSYHISITDLQVHRAHAQLRRLGKWIYETCPDSTTIHLHERSVLCLDVPDKHEYYFVKQPHDGS